MTLCVRARPPSTPRPRRVNAWVWAGVVRGARARGPDSLSIHRVHESRAQPDRAHVARRWPTLATVARREHGIASERIATRGNTLAGRWTPTWRLYA